MSYEHRIMCEQLRHKLSAVERERDELKAMAEEQSQLAGRNAARVQQAEAEIARRDAAAGEAVAWKWRLTSIHDSAQIGPWRVCLSPLMPGKGAGWKTEAIPLYTAAQSAVLPPEMKPEPDSADRFDHGFIAGYNQCRADALALGAQPQPVFVLPNGCGERYAWSDGVHNLLSDIKSGLDAANVKWEVKK